MPRGFVYVLDANVFIEAARRYYAFDLAPRFWEILIDRAENGEIQSIDLVRKELERGKDKLADWAKIKFGHAFASTDEAAVMESYKEIISWVQAQDQYSDVAKTDFANDPDGWLVAYARAKGYIVVTHEVLAPDARRKIPIPNICRAFNVPFVDTFEMLRTFGVRFA